MYNIYLSEADLLKVEQFPVVALINEACNTDIIEFVENLIHKIGCGYNYSSCSFWEDMDEYEQSSTPHFDGMWVGNEAGEEVIISYSDLLYYLEALYSRLFADNFSRMQNLREALDTFKATFCSDGNKMKPNI